jgi:hypothetical protein
MAKKTHGAVTRKKYFPSPSRLLTRQTLKEPGAGTLHLETLSGQLHKKIQNTLQGSSRKLQSLLD